MTSPPVVNFIRDTHLPGIPGRRLGFHQRQLLLLRPIERNPCTTFVYLYPSRKAVGLSSFHLGALQDRGRTLAPASDSRGPRRSRRAKSTPPRRLIRSRAMAVSRHGTSARHG
jgi:hypothetical protein